MPRLVVPRDPGTGQLRSESIKGMPPDNYADRLVKYIPVEAVAFYTAVDKFLASKFSIVAGADLPVGLPPKVQAFAWAFFILGIVGTPAYLWRAKLKDQPWILNAGLATVAFVFWAYALGGTVFVVQGWYDTFAACLFAPIFTFVAGIAQPRK